MDAKLEIEHYGMSLSAEVNKEKVIVLHVADFSDDVEIWLNRDEAKKLNEWLTTYLESK